MKYLKGFLIFILILTLLLLGVVGLCAVNPKLAETIGNILYKNSNEQIIPAEASADNEETNPEADYPYYGLYEVPDISSMEVPSELSLRTGYTPIEEIPVEVTDPVADELEDTLGYGELGDDLTFDALFYPFYHMLNEKEKHLYRQIVANANALIDRFKPIEDCNSSELKRVFEAVFNDHPELFWLDTSYSYSKRNNGEIVEIDLKFNRTADNLSESKSKFNENAEEILSNARGLSSDFEKEKYVHDALVNKIEYNLNAPMNQSAYSALVNGSTVCAGYARAFQYLMQQLGIPCYYCTGYAGESHAWNIIKLDDDFYNVDVTWDDSEAGNYDWFNKTDADYKSTHARRDMSVNLPPCNGTGYQVESTKASAEPTSDPYEQVMPEYGNSRDTPGENADTTVDIPNEIYYTLDNYFDACKQSIIERGTGRYVFENVIVGKDMLSAWQQSYNNGSYKEKYANEVLDTLNADNLRMNLSVTALDNDMYLITHEIEID